MPSVIVGSANYQVVEMDQIPAGVTSEFSEMCCKMAEKTVEKGDCILLFSDGVYDSFQNGGVSQKVFYEYLASVVRKYQGDEKRCHKTAEEILVKASTFLENKDGDDMSVAVLEIR